MKNRERCKEQGNRLRAERLSRGITQEKMAEYMDVSVREYRRYEAGDATLPFSFISIVKQFNLDCSYILTGQLSIDFQIELGMNTMPDDMYHEKLGEILMSCKKLSNNVDIEMFKEGILGQFLEFAEYYKENSTLPHVRKVDKIYIFTMLYEMENLKGLLKKSRVETYEEMFGLVPH